MVGIAKIIAAALTLALCSACGESFRFVGRWEGNRKLEVPKGSTREVAHLMGKVELSVHGNGTFDLLESGLPKRGRYRIQNNVLFLKITHILDRPVEDMGSSTVAMNQDLVARPVGPDQISFADPAGFDTNPVTLKRVATG